MPSWNRFCIVAFIMGSIITQASHADDSCDQLTAASLASSDFSLHIPYAQLDNNFVTANFRFLPDRAEALTWQLTNAVFETTPLPDSCLNQSAVAGSQLTLQKILVDGQPQFSAHLNLISQTDGFYLVLNDYAVLNDSNPGNSAPVASSLSQQADSSIAYQVINLIASDNDGDTLGYELLSPTSGSGYESAYINPLIPKLYLTLQPGFSGAIVLNYRATDGQLYSETASVTLNVTSSNNERGLGLQNISAEEYASFNFSSPNGDLFGAPGATATLPASVDLSANFPVPGDQGQTNSCVGWATAYALKSYQEKLEIGWSLNTPEHLFSPSFVYNQINGGRDQGSIPSEALDLAVNKGIATLATMPFTSPFEQPSNAAFTEATNFKAASWSALRSVNDIKAELANKNGVLMGIRVFSQLNRLSGTDSVYNDYSGQDLGGHAVTAVGYDDNRYGGAFKIINSWSTNWGDQGYFWLPYSGTNQVLMLSMALQDADNSTTVNTTDDPRTEPEPTGNLPNLVVSDWNLNYDARPGGQGQLQYQVVNNGTAPAPAGANITLVLSKDQNINANDAIVVYESIGFDLQPGEYVYRSENNAINFQFPTDLDPGEYYLSLWVDDQNMLTESNETDNISFAANTINFENNLADLNIDFWAAEFVDNYGNAALIYNIVNSGASTAAGGWDINLVLSSDPIIGNGNEWYLIYETIPFDLAPGETAYRDYSFPTYFNLYQDYYGDVIPSGEYYMAFWIDDLDTVPESNEDNNFSFNGGLVPIYGYGSGQNARFNFEAHNGKGFIRPNNVAKINLSRNQRGETVIKPVASQPAEVKILPKTVSANDRIVFPNTQGFAMP